MDDLFTKRLEESLYVHFPLKLEEDRSLDRKAREKKATCSICLWNGKDTDCWSYEGEGMNEVLEDGILRLKTWSRSDHWPESEIRSYDESSGRYCTFGNYIAKLDVSKLKIQRGNRIAFRVKPDCPGSHSTILRIGFVNNGAVKIPDAYSREGFNAVNLKNHEWNDCYWEIDSMAHDRLTEVSFNIHRYGINVTNSDDITYDLKDIRFEEVECNVAHGWKCKENTIAFATTGYVKTGEKIAVANTACKEFELIDANNEKTALRGEIKTVNNIYGDFQILDFTRCRTEGNYKLKIDGFETEVFEISDSLYQSTLWKLINFLYCERCGYPVPQCHGSCHADVIAEHNGQKLSFNGGWHDAADVSQQVVQSAEVVEGILTSAMAVKESDFKLYLRMIEEANWGLDYILRMRFGDGYRAAHAPLRRWTDGIIGNFDDEFVDVNNCSFENFIFAAVEIKAGSIFESIDNELSWKLKEAAKEDFAFAMERFRKVGVEKARMSEHTSNASRSQYYAVLILAASRLYRITRDSQYAQYTDEYVQKLLKCQETNKGLKLNGYFYRDEEKKHIVHFCHQARDQIFAMALVEVCDVFKESDLHKQCEKALGLHAIYLKKLNEYATPYGMIPAGVYHISECEDKETFAVMHLNAEFEREKENYKEQLKQGIDLGGGYYIRMFPVWFSFRGNSAIHLSMGKAASLIGKYFCDEELLEIGRNQLYWTLGKNPFNQSLVYGEGSNYSQEYTALLGETVGEIPVGIQTRRNEDIPYWPQACIATYREVWTTPAGKWMMLAGDLI